MACVVPKRVAEGSRVSTIDVKVPDIGDFKDVPVIEVFVKPGDQVGVDDSLVTLESDKATMDVPSPAAGKVAQVAVKVGDKVSEGSLVLTLDSAHKAAPQGAKSGDGAGGSASHAASRPATATPAPAPELVTPAPRGEKGRADMPGEGASATPPAGATVEVRVPDIGDFKDVPIIEILVKPGDIVKPDDPLVTLESDKATMDVPASVGGVVEGVRVGVGDKVSQGTALLTLKTAQTGVEPASRATPPSFPANADRANPPIEPPPASPHAAGPEPSQGTSRPVQRPDVQQQAGAAPGDEAAARGAHASPSVRKFARELGVDIGRVRGTGPKGRILHDDVQSYVKSALAGAPAAASAPAALGGLSLQPWPQVDFTKFGAVESKPLSRIRKISGANLARNWVMIPHVTQFDDADVTELEALRVALNKENEKSGVKVTMLAFLIKASVAALAKFPDFNASLDASGENLFYKRYFNIGFAADTPNGLVVPVIKGAEQKGVLAIAKEMGELSAKAREGKLGPADMQGGSFSISSLGGIGGTAFTPIINAPEVAILGVSRSVMKPVWNGKEFAPRLMLPLSLSYDHRVIDGAQAARFITYFASVLADLRRALL
ncbi:MAG TPA: dihydrolipoyllysine-residue acetyltransferase [Casimicrobiaceae bacterium]|nr:dihydrolipoyllysine-residue acetyltransferase [Casimicrobiaceae bacterium]